MRVMVLGGGGREHALGWKILQERPEATLFFLPGNGGTGAIGTNLPGRESDPDDVSRLAREYAVDWVIVGPEAPLVAGVSDRLAADGIPVFGPSSRAAEIEGSKVFSKTLLRDHGVSTPAFEIFSELEPARAAVQEGAFPKVIKADGLAAGKGVIIAETATEGLSAVESILSDRAFGSAGSQILIESFVRGDEISAFAIVRDEEFVLLPLSQDHKRIGEGDTGPNTGGMGAYAPYPGTTPALLETIRKDVFQPTLRAMVEVGRPFRGLLYAGLILAEGRPWVLEFNCRFGDPETQAVVRLSDGWVDAMLAVAEGKGPLITPVPADRGRSAAATVVLASSGYPGSYETGCEISGLEDADSLPDVEVFHAGTHRTDSRVQTSGGRVLAVSATGAELQSALDRAYEAVALIDFEGKTWRRDIGFRALERTET